MEPPFVFISTNALAVNPVERNAVSSQSLCSQFR